MSETAELVERKKITNGCLLAALITVGVVVLLGVGGVLLVNRSLTNFEARRDTMGLRSGLAVTDEHCRYSPGFDGAMWAKFTATAGSIDDVFDLSRVDTSDFDEAGYQFNLVTAIIDPWWDANTRTLTGGESMIGPNVIRVAYADNGDGTLTVYIYWFEV